MNRLTCAVWLLVVVGGANALGQPSKPIPDRPKLVEAVGCLSQTGASWVLSNATEPAASTTSFTTPEAVKAATEKPLGTQQIRLLGIAPFGPDRNKGHKLVVRGLLIKDGSDTRINLTSLQTLAETCVK